MGAVASYVVGYRVRKNSRSRLEEYLQTVHGVSEASLNAAAAAWAEYLAGQQRPLVAPDLPYLSDIISALDIVHSDGSSLGPSAFGRDGKPPREFEGNELRRVRD